MMWKCLHLWVFRQTFRLVFLPIVLPWITWRWLFPDTLALGRMALRRGQLERAEKLAHRILHEIGQKPRDWNYGNQFFAAHELLGLVELRRGNVKGAKKQLRLAAKTPGSPQLDTGGANHVLAFELLQIGEKDAVLEYLHALRHWYRPSGFRGRGYTDSADEWSDWIAQIERSETPRHQRWHGVISHLLWQ